MQTYATVLGSVLTVILAMYFGFQAVLWISGAIYVIGYLAIRPLLQKHRSDMIPKQGEFSWVEFVKKIPELPARMVEKIERL